MAVNDRTKGKQRAAEDDTDSRSLPISTTIYQHVETVLDHAVLTPLAPAIRYILEAPLDRLALTEHALIGTRFVQWLAKAGLPEPYSVLAILSFTGWQARRFYFAQKELALSLLLTALPAWQSIRLIGQSGTLLGQLHSDAVKPASILRVLDEVKRLLSYWILWVSIAWLEAAQLSPKRHQPNSAFTPAPTVMQTRSTASTLTRFFSLLPRLLGSLRRSAGRVPAALTTSPSTLRKPFPQPKAWDQVSAAMSSSAKYPLSFLPPTTNTTRISLAQGWFGDRWPTLKVILLLWAMSSHTDGAVKLFQLIIEPWQRLARHYDHDDFGPAKRRIVKVVLAPQAREDAQAPRRHALRTVEESYPSVASLPDSSGYLSQASSSAHAAGSATLVVPPATPKRTLSAPTPQHSPLHGSDLHAEMARLDAAYQERQRRTRALEKDGALHGMIGELDRVWTQPSAQLLPSQAIAI
ncbi:uncharacterized protein L969DRAFT_100590 [Mixia osmundae IAM 14324]|uniref:Uncharacterized protein n=1 Tax=Mixia osmundae (strain CBS 9802 / IAM 14324 / JCM 22182 / KY 12970) TaxID=764103 RepID=G7DVA7_MIXOS|nr:uncharacterized protein L969DRAFT_100590 [Mixia osmundae IAM 14324]KEI42060.1 hypothetical protein L969DRAFT_100590 [Mixia osmundae IAM 14324]GAA94517.1 hypothetical protein E5Q_01169 [Mixia osmundae IAM 14324]